MNELENIVSCSLPSEWRERAYEEESDGFSTGNCGSLTVVSEYIAHVKDEVALRDDLLASIKKDYLLRGEVDDDGIIVVNMSSSIWETLNSIVKS